jgi:hypothetical protein
LCLDLRSICIPAHVDEIDGSAFAGSGIIEVRIAAGNEHFVVCEDFLLSSDRHCLIRYFGRSAVVNIGSDIEIVGGRSFHSCEWVRGLAFDPSSHVRCICEGAFEKCINLYSIILPRSTECLVHFSFRKCRNLRELFFENGSKLCRIERESFAGCSSLESIWIPKMLKGQGGVDVSGAGDVEINWY